MNMLGILKAAIIMTKPAFSFGFGHNVLKKSLMENFIFCAVNATQH